MGIGWERPRRRAKPDDLRFDAVRLLRVRWRSLSVASLKMHLRRLLIAELQALNGTSRRRPYSLLRRRRLQVAARLVAMGVNLGPGVHKLSLPHGHRLPRRSRGIPARHQWLGSGTFVPWE